jgi:2'-5' RNA ligase
MITLETGITHFSPGFHPHITIYRNASHAASNIHSWEYMRTYFHARPASMVRAFLAMMTLAKKQKEE